MDEKEIDEYMSRRKNAKCTSCQYWFTCERQDQSKLECEWYKPLKAENYSDRGVNNGRNRSKIDT